MERMKYNRLSKGAIQYRPQGRKVVTRSEKRWSDMQWDMEQALVTSTLNGKDEKGGDI